MPGMYWMPLVFVSATMLLRAMFCYAQAWRVVLAREMDVAFPDASEQELKVSQMREEE